MTSRQEIEKYLKKYLQREISIKLEGKTIKQGRFILFSIKDFFCILTLTINDKQIVYELPYPFNLTEKDSTLIFDYTLDSFCYKNEKLAESVSLLNIKSPSKFYNKLVLFEAV